MATADTWKVHSSMLERKVILQLNLPIQGQNGQIAFPRVTGKILEDMGESILFEHAPKPGQALVVEQMPKNTIFSVVRESSVLA